MPHPRAVSVTVNERVLCLASGKLELTHGKGCSGALRGALSTAMFRDFHHVCIITARREICVWVSSYIAVHLHCLNGSAVYVLQPPFMSFQVYNITPSLVFHFSFVWIMSHKTNLREHITMQSSLPNLDRNLKGSFEKSLCLWHKKHLDYHMPDHIYILHRYVDDHN